MKFSRLVIILAILPVLFSNFCYADPAALYFDPGMTHEYLGVNRYPKANGEWEFDLHISPFYQHASGARDKDGNKVPIGDRLGRWEIFGLLWGNMDAAPEDLPYNSTNYPSLYYFKDKAEDDLGLTEDSSTGKYDLDGDYSIPLTYEKLGLRFELDMGMASGFGLTIKSGVVDYKQTPTDFINKSTSTNTEVKAFLDEMMSFSGRRNMIEEDLGINLGRQQTTSFEDTYAQLYWSNSFKFNDKEGRHVLNVAPYVGAGVWIPTGKKKDQDKAFSMPTGHDGFWGLSFEGALNFDFPDTVLINIGGVITFFETKTLCGQRVPNHYLQAGIYPWKAKIRKTFGPAWSVNFSLIGKNIMDNVSVYCDYIYSKHERDTITMKESSASRNELFYPNMLEEDSYWKSQMIQVGFGCHVTPNLTFGISGQTHISGVRVYKTHTVMGTVTFTF